MPACVHGWSPLGACSTCTPPSTRSRAVTFASPAEIAGQLEPGDYLLDAQANLLRVQRSVPTSPKVQLAGQYDLVMLGCEIEYRTGYDDTTDVRWPLRRARVVVDDDEGVSP